MIRLIETLTLGLAITVLFCAVLFISVAAPTTAALP
jgi:hypothetical protein